ncbi:hypothetical protein H7J88_18705 [Mycolicibacterium flavescens]|nr:hypothetical protein [Mycolicibacterium flavescens]MCV7281668.1 hypothetical protein [Mycolicibacterium flavescens]
MAKVANMGAQNLRQAWTAAVDAISEAEADDFRVGSDLSVSDRGRYTSQEGNVYAARKVKAEEHHSFIAMRTGALLSEDNQVGTRLQEGAVALANMIPASWGVPPPEQPMTDGNGGLEPYDSDDGSYTGREIAKELEQFTDGKRRGIKEVDTEDEIFDLWERFSHGGVRVPIPEDVADKIYDRVVLPDGTTVGVRESAGHGPTLDVGYPPGVDGPKKVHLPESPPPPIPPAAPPPARGEAPLIASPPQMPVVDHPPTQAQPGLPPPWAPDASVLDPPQVDLPAAPDPGILAGVGTAIAGIGGFLAFLAKPWGAFGS